MSVNTLEDYINDANQAYLKKRRAVITKQHPPIVMKYSGMWKLAGTAIVDYSGVYEGRHIAIEAKMYKNPPFPMGKIKEHQVEHLVEVAHCGGIFGFIIMFSEMRKIWVVRPDNNWLKEHWYARKGMHVAAMEKYGIEVTFTRRGFPFLDYLSGVDKLWKKIEKK